MSKSVENMTENLAPCPFCGGNEMSVVEINMEDGQRQTFMGCHTCGSSGPCTFAEERAVAAWNDRATTAPKHRPAEVLTGKDRRNIGDALFRGNIHVEHVLPLHAAPNEMGLYGGWKVLGEALRERDWGQLEELFPCESGEWLAEEMRGNEALLCALRQIGGWVILGTYSTIGDIKFTEKGDFASCAVYCGVERGFTVWGKTYKQAIAKAINEQRRYRRREVAKAREAAGHGRA